MNDPGRPIAVSPTSAAPTPAGPYSQAVRAGGFLFLSGQAGYLPDSRKLVGADIQEQTRQTLRNVSAVLEHAGSSLEQITKVTVYLANIDQREVMNEEYAACVGDPAPARTTIAASLPKGVLIEVDVIAVDTGGRGSR